MYSRILLLPLKLLIFIFVVTFIFQGTSQASVTILGSRIIYPGNAASVDVQLKNNDKLPYVIQTWFDDGNMDSKPADQRTVPFIATPPVFRIQPLAGQILRVVFTNDKTLPQNRETVYWFNSLQIPPSNLASESGKNSMLLMLRNRIKIFYRPVGIGKPDNLFGNVKVAVNDGSVEVHNDQPWYLSLVEVSLKTGNKKIACQVDMIAPFSKKGFKCKTAVNGSPGNRIVSLSAMNDQGARVSENYPIIIR
jgi:P pilus assembly chaperone PapD